MVVENTESEKSSLTKTEGSDEIFTRGLEKINELDEKTLLEDWDWVPPGVKIEKIIIGETIGIFDEKRIEKLLTEIFEKELETKEKTTQMSNEILNDENSLDYQKRIANFDYVESTKMINIYRDFLSKTESDNKYLMSWYEEQKKILTDTRLDFYNHLQSVQDRFSSLFGEEVLNRLTSLQDRIFIYPPYTFDIFRNSDSETPFKVRTIYLQGFLNNTKIDEDPNIIVKMDWDLIADEKGVRIEVDKEKVRRIIIHESLHMIPKPGRREYYHDYQIKDLGFARKYFDLNGDPTFLRSSEKDGTPLLAIDEGTVSFLESLISFGEKLDSDYPELPPEIFHRMEEGRYEYGISAYAMYELSRDIGIKAIAKSYFNSDIESLFNIMREKMKPEYLKNFLTKMSALQEIYVKESLDNVYI